MAIKASSAKQIDALVADLSSTSLVTRESAVARLTVIGARAVERVIAVVGSSQGPAGRAAALRALEAIGDPRALDAALRALNDVNVDVATAAAGAARVFVRGPRGSVAVDRLMGVAVDARRDVGVRLAAIQALDTLEATSLKPLWKTLLADPEPVVRSLAGARAPNARPTGRDAAADLTDAAERGLPDDPAVLRDAITGARGGVPLGILHRLIERVRDREAGEGPAAWRAEWTRVRGMLHVALATRGSRLALYDVRETLESAGSVLPVEFLTALSEIGDASCLEAIAASYARAASADDDWWRGQLADAFRAIVLREALTRRHAVMKRVAKRWPSAYEGLWAGKSGRAGA